ETNFDPGYEPDWAVISTVKQNREKEPVPIRETGAFPIILSTSYKYYLIQREKTWSDAQAYCQATYTDLALVK
ncbi:putative C-type lectin domain family 20 member A isoform X1, partial [Clarias magur]